ncbi:MAG: hypothetical protein RL722_281 [Pseudomonadota bacterium]|jgi:hypothetical protein
MSPVAFSEPSRRPQVPAWLLALLLVLLSSWVLGPSLPPRLLDTGSSLSGRMLDTTAAATQHAVQSGTSASPSQRHHTASGSAAPSQGEPALAPASLAVMAATGLLTLFALMLALTQRHAPDLALAGAGALWTLQIAGADLLPPAAQRGLMPALLLAFCSLTGWYATVVLDLRPGRGRPALPALGLLTILLLVWALGAAGAMDATLGNMVVLATIVGLGGLLLVQVIAATQRELLSHSRRLAAWAVALTLAIALGCLVHELGRQLGLSALLSSQLSALPAPGSALGTRWAALALLLVLTAVRLEQLARGQRRLGFTLTDQQTQMRELQRSLEVTLDELHQREHQAAERLQRDRLLHELHTELCQQLQRLHPLVSAPSRSSVQTAGEPPRHGQAMRRVSMSGLLDAALLDLRLALGALDRHHPLLAEALGDLRRHAEPLVQARGARLHWRLSPATSRLRIGSADTLQLLRMAQEALLQALQDADATSLVSLTLDLHDEADQRSMRLQVSALHGQGQDQRSPATGLPLEMPGPGLVMPDWGPLHQRARTLAARVLATPLSQGWGVEIQLDLPNGRRAGSAA